LSRSSKGQDFQQHIDPGFRRRSHRRFDVGEQSSAAYQASLWAAMVELSYYWSLPENSRSQGHLRLAATRDDAFTEIGDSTPITGSAVTATRLRLLVGAELGHSWLVDRRILDFAVYARLVDNLSQNFGTQTVLLANEPSLLLLVSGVRESQLGADAGATLSAKVTDAMQHLHRL
jgi:hypothetical protein